MKTVAHVIFENEDGELLLCLRDNEPSIPFPHHWNLIGGHIEEGESVEDGLIREVKEELNLNLMGHKFWRSYVCLEGDVHPNIKYMYTAKINLPIEEITLMEGEKVQYFTKEEVLNLKLANIESTILSDYIQQFGHRLK